MDPAEAKRYLRSIDAGVQFWFSNGKTACNLKELLLGILSLDDGGFKHHVYFDHNDFSHWLMDIIGDERLARDIFGVGQPQAIALIKARISYLERQARQQ
jgi:hypothetical protein